MSARKGFRLEQSDVLATVAEVGSARLDDLAEYLGWHWHTVRRSADGLVAQGKLTVLPGHYPETNAARVYVYGDGSPEQTPT
jgi:DNA-binding MarR family transcriptional regulator